ncbi:MAG TPA: DoxX family protein [Thermoanaerobaculia bacterium]|jgi:hypothetical protein|nr:DoxX family protein [Thermoanaerobaculia bacterium]
MRSNVRLWTGRAITALPILFLLFDGIIKLINIPPVVESFTRLGYRTSIAMTIGLIELALIALYLFPRTAIAGAVLLTGFLGGAIATHLRVGDPLLTHTLFPVYIAAPLWGGLWLRDARLRVLFSTKMEK